MPQPDRLRERFARLTRNGDWGEALQLAKNAGVPHAVIVSSLRQARFVSRAAGEDYLLWMEELRLRAQSCEERSDIQGLIEFADSFAEARQALESQSVLYQLQLRPLRQVAVQVLIAIEVASHLGFRRGNPESADPRGAFLHEATRSHAFWRDVAEGGSGLLAALMRRCSTLHCRSYETPPESVVYRELLLRGHIHVLGRLGDYCQLFGWELSTKHSADHIELEFIPSDHAQALALEAGRRWIFTDGVTRALRREAQAEAILGTHRAELRSLVTRAGKIDDARLVSQIGISDSLRSDLWDLAAGGGIETWQSIWLKSAQAGGLGDLPQGVDKMQTVLEYLAWGHELAVRASGSGSTALSPSSSLVWLPTGEPATLLALLAGLNGGLADSAARLLTTDLSIPDQRVDLFMRPLIRLSGNWTVMAPSFVLTGTRGRNVMKLLTTAAGLELTETGESVEAFTRSLFRGQGFATNEGKLKLTRDGQDVGDIDVAAYKGGALFLGQVKTFLAPDSVFEEWRAVQTVLEAQDQAVTAERFYTADRETVLGRLTPPVRREDVLSVHSFIVTTAELLNSLPCAYPVVGLEQLGHVLSIGYLLERSPEGEERVPLRSGAEASAEDVLSFFQCPDLLQRVLGPPPLPRGKLRLPQVNGGRDPTSVYT